MSQNGKYQEDYNVNYYYDVKIDEITSSDSGLAKPRYILKKSSTNESIDISKSKNKRKVTFSCPKETNIENKEKKKNLIENEPVNKQDEKEE